MVRDQIESRGIRDQQVLAAMRRIPRHLFVPESVRSQSYDDCALPIPEGQTISQPYIVAVMSELLQLTPEDRVLEIGTGCGYQTVVLAEIVQEVYTLEIIYDLYRLAVCRFQEFGYQNIHARCMDGFDGWVEASPFTRIILTCAPPKVPPPLLLQLAEDGRMVVPEGEQWQELVLYTKQNGIISCQKNLDVRFVPMTGRVQRSR